MTDPEVIRAWIVAHLDKDELYARDGLANAPIVTIHLSGGRVESVVEGALWWQRVFREVEAKRRRLDRHAPLVAARSWPPMCSCCEAPWPCLDVIDDAQAWADDPTMPEELKLP